MTLSGKSQPKSVKSQVLGQEFLVPCYVAKIALYSSTNSGW